MRKASDPDAQWAFPNLEILRKVFEDVRGSIPHFDILSTALSSNVDPVSKLATVVLDTRNYTVFKLVREKIRQYNGIPGFAFDTYEMSAFIKNHSLTMYIPAQYSKMPPALTMGCLLYTSPSPRD